MLRRVPRNAAAPATADAQADGAGPRSAGARVAPRTQRQLAAPARQPAAPVRAAGGGAVRRPLLRLGVVASCDRRTRGCRYAVSPASTEHVKRAAPAPGGRGSVAQPATRPGAASGAVAPSAGAASGCTCTFAAGPGDVAAAGDGHVSAGLSHVRGGQSLGVQQPCDQAIHPDRQPAEAGPLCACVFPRALPRRVPWRVCFSIGSLRCSDACMTHTVVFGRSRLVRWGCKSSYATGSRKSV